MRKSLHYVSLVFAFITLTSISPGKKEIPSISKTFCFVRANEVNPLILLKLYSDNTFEFFDKSKSHRVIDVEGRYYLNGNKIKLTEYDSPYTIAETWVMDDKFPCIKARKAMKFTRICNCE